MRRLQNLIRPLAPLILTVGLAIAVAAVGSSSALATKDLFAVLGVQRPANPGLAPDLKLPGLDGRTVHLKDFRGKVVLLGFFTST